jgi:hypothetical protein
MPHFRLLSAAGVDRSPSVEDLLPAILSELGGRATHLELNRSDPSHGFWRVSEGTRTPDRRDHNPELYQLSYAHRGGH